METKTLPTGAIVVGVDAGVPSERAVGWAADEAALDHRPLVLAHAIGSFGTTGTTWLTDTDDAHASETVRRLRATGEELLSRAAEQATRRHPTLAVHTAVVAADARPALLALSRSARTVVVGSRGRGTARSRLLGSVSAAVARQAPCPVVVVRPHNPGTVRRGVLVGADGTAESAPALEFAYREASIRRLPLTVMHCVWDSVASLTGPHPVRATEPGLEDSRLLLAESTSGMTEKYPDVHVTLELARGLPEDCLAAAAARMDVLVVGRRHVGRINRVLFGDVTDKVVEHAACVVAVVPDA
jgi:nucleotide-binding universal stress UspA family protein